MSPSDITSQLALWYGNLWGGRSWASVGAANVRTLTIALIFTRLLPSAVTAPRWRTGLCPVYSETKRRRNSSSVMCSQSWGSALKVFFVSGHSLGLDSSRPLTRWYSQQNGQRTMCTVFVPSGSGMRGVAPRSEYPESLEMETKKQGIEGLKLLYVRDWLGSVNCKVPY